jgi:hypothetical protein
VSANPDDIPLDYQWIDWDHLYKYVGRAMLADHVPMMTEKIAKYLEEQARTMHKAADKMTVAAQALRATTKKS